MTAFIDDHRDDHGVESICKVFPIAPSTYYTHAAIICDPNLASDRAKRDAKLLPEIQRVFDDNYEVYGVRKSLPPLRRGSGGRCSERVLILHVALWPD